MLLRSLEYILTTSRFPLLTANVVEPFEVTMSRSRVDLARAVADLGDLAETPDQQRAVEVAAQARVVVNPSVAARVLDSLLTVDTILSSVDLAAITPDPDPDLDLDAELEAALDADRVREMEAAAASEAMPDLVEDYLTGPVTDQDRAPNTHRYSEDTDHIHVSALVDLCPRAYALARQNNTVIHNSPSGAMRIVWEMGLALEAHVVRQMRAAFGRVAVTANMVLRDEEYRIVGRPDALIEVTAGWNVVVEIKTMEAVGFGRLHQPLANHVLQALLYHWLADRAGLQVHDEIILLYVAKDFVRGGVYKEYHVNHRDVACQNMLEMALGLAMELRQAMDRNGVPARRICDVPGCRRARGCPVATLCFNMMAEAT